MYSFVTDATDIGPAEYINNLHFFARTGMAEGDGCDYIVVVQQVRHYTCFARIRTAYAVPHVIHVHLHILGLCAVARIHMHAMFAQSLQERGRKAQH